MRKDRRSLLKSLFENEAGHDNIDTQPVTAGEKVQDVPMFSPFRKHGNLVFVSGHGNRYDGDIRVHTDNVIKVIEEKLKNAGSSLDKVLKVNVYLNDINDMQGLNEVFRGRFGSNPPVRTTVAVNGGLPPADAYIQMDCIAYV